jgi:choline dehydrogenase-like flavoprotein
MDAPYLLEAGYWRMINGQLRWPRPARYELHLVIEQAPEPRETISLSETRDRMGLPRARIDWRISETDRAYFRCMSTAIDAFWRRRDARGFGRLAWLQPPQAIDISTLPDAGDVFHPGGSTRMGANRESSVVDENLLVWDIPNLALASTSVFPSGGGANPTMTLMALALRLGAHIERTLTADKAARALAHS